LGVVRLPCWSIASARRAGAQTTASEVRKATSLIEVDAPTNNFS
jgi:hypothetical protein